ncbi:thioesterase family protein [Pararhodospirillum oryzae]|nr:thioesterase family protein [Pararhodospirillum oryzae]
MTDSPIPTPGALPQPCVSAASPAVPPVETGVTLSRPLSVDASRTVTFLGEDLRVYATYALIRDLEYACRDLLVGHLPAGWDSVGTQVNLDHKAASPLGARVRLGVTLARVEGARVTFAVQAHDEVGLIAEGSHERFMAPVDSFARRLQARARPAAPPPPSPKPAQGLGAVF